MATPPSEAGELEGQNWKCPVCFQDREIRLSKSGRPYVLCNECGVQCFVRGDVGIRKMHRILTAPENEAEGWIAGFMGKNQRSLW